MQGTEPQWCPVCDGEWHAEDCELGQEVARRLKAENEAANLRARLLKIEHWAKHAMLMRSTQNAELLRLVHGEA